MYIWLPDAAATALVVRPIHSIASRIVVPCRYGHDKPLRKRRVHDVHGALFGSHSQVRSSATFRRWRQCQLFCGGTGIAGKVSHASRHMRTEW